jgi:hypothetical protein
VSVALSVAHIIQIYRQIVRWHISEVKQQQELVFKHKAGAAAGQVSRISPKNRTFCRCHQFSCWTAFFYSLTLVKRQKHTFMGYEMKHKVWNFHFVGFFAYRRTFISRACDFLSGRKSHNCTGQSGLTLSGEVRGLCRPLSSVWFGCLDSDESIMMVSSHSLLCDDDDDEEK